MIPKSFNSFIDLRECIIHELAHHAQNVIDEQTNSSLSKTWFNNLIGKHQITAYLTYNKFVFVFELLDLVANYISYPTIWIFSV